VQVLLGSGDAAVTKTFLDHLNVSTPGQQPVRVYVPQMIGMTWKPSCAISSAFNQTLRRNQSRPMCPSVSTRRGARG
jgi:hypothetical protein